MTSPVRRWTPQPPLIALFPTIVFPIRFLLQLNFMYINETDFTLDLNQKYH